MAEAADPLRLRHGSRALELCELLAAAGDSRYQAAARRWLGRFLAEKGASLTETLIAGAALAELGERPNSPLARDTLEQLLDPPP